MLAAIASSTSDNLAARTAPAVQRHDLYRNIHKALRSLMGDTLARLGAVDADDPLAAAVVFTQVRELLDLLAHHLHTEETHVLPAIERRRPGATIGNARDHVGHERELRELRMQAAAVETAIAVGAPDRADAAQRAFLALGDFIAENFVHMATEERHMNPILWALFTDEELREIEAGIISRQKPEESMRVLRWMMPALTPAERAKMVLGARAVLPPQMFESLLAFIRSVLTPANVAKLDDALDR